MKNLNLILSFLISLTVIFSCGNSSKNGNSDENSSENIISADLSSSDKIDAYCQNIEKDISADKLLPEQLTTSCAEQLTEIYFTRFTDNSGIVKLETTTSSENFYKMEDYYFANDKIVEKYYYLETYVDGNTTVDEKITYFIDEEITKITQKTGSGINIDKAFQQYALAEISELSFKDSDSKQLKSEISILKTIINQADLSKFFCK